MKVIERLFLRSWWVGACLLLCGIAYEKGASATAQESEKLGDLRFQLLQKKEHALQKKEKLLLRLNSASDPRWVELVLMEGLGLIPEGQTKIYFSEKRGS